MGWLKRLLGNAADPAPAPLSTTLPPVEPTWSEAHRIGGLISGGDEVIERWLTQAETDWVAFTDSASENATRFANFLDEAEGDPVATFRAVLVSTGYLGYLDWKFPATEVLWQFSNVLERAGLPRLTDPETASFAALDPIDERQDDLFFPDLAPALDHFLKEKNYRLLGCSEGADSYPFAVVKTDAYRQLLGAEFGWFSFYDVTNDPH